MRLQYLFFVLLMSFSALAQTGPDEEFEELICKESEAHRNMVEGLLSSNPLTGNYDLKYYRFAWYIDPAQYYIDGAATVYFETLEDGFSEINFDFSSALGIDSITYHGTNLNYSQTGSYLLTIQLPAPLTKGTLDSMTIVYAGAPPASGLGSFVQSTHAGTPVLWTLSDPFGSQDWWPCKNGLGDKIDSIDVIITTPEAYRAASNGMLIGEWLIGNEKVYHWQHRYPITPYLVAIAVTNYTAYSDTVALKNGADLQMLNFVYPESEATARSGTADLVQVLQFFDSLFVTYPFHNEKYGHAQFGWGGGMEHQTMSFVFNFGWSLLAHELAHQWFGDMVTCASFEDIWLNEGSATYLEGLTQERFRGAGAWQGWKSGRLNNITSQTGGSVRVPDTTNINRIFSGRLSYNKGAYLLHMLRWKLGDENFFQGMRNFLQAFQYAYARTPQFQAELEYVTDTDLSEFFADWYHGEGYPRYTVTWDQQGDEFIVRLGQTTSHPSVDFFEMPVPLRLVGAGVDTMIRLEHMYADQVFSLPVSFEVTSVEFDPDLWLISRDNVVLRDKVSSVIKALSGGVSGVLYPNPAGDFMNLRMDGNTAGHRYDWRLYSTLGSQLSSGTLEGHSGVTLDLHGYPGGLYIVRLSDEEGGSVSLVFARE